MQFFSQVRLLLGAVYQKSIYHIRSLRTEAKNSPDPKPNRDPKPIRNPNPFPIPNFMPLTSGFHMAFKPTWENCARNFRFNGYDLVMPAKIRSAGDLSQNPHAYVIATNICFLTTFTELEITKCRPIIGGPNALWPTQPKFWTHAAEPPMYARRQPPP